LTPEPPPLEYVVRADAYRLYRGRGEFRLLDSALVEGSTESIEDLLRDIRTARALYRSGSETETQRETEEAFWESAAI